GIEDTNAVIKNSTPSGAAAATNVFFDNFDSYTGLGSWSISYFAANATDWRGSQVCAPTHSGANTFHWGGTTCAANYANSVASFATPPGNTVYGMRIPESATATKLS